MNDTTTYAQFTYNGQPYPLMRLRCCTAYGASNVWCDGCHRFFWGDDEVYHTDHVVSGTHGGFDLCIDCCANLRFTTASSTASDPPTAMTPPIQSRVTCHGLAQRVDLNGRTGTVVKHAPSGRVGVLFDGDLTPFAVPTRNLTLCPHVVYVEADYVRIVAPAMSTVVLNGKADARRLVPISELGWSEDVPGTVTVDGVEHTVRFNACAICMSAFGEGAMHKVVGHPLHTCDTCTRILKGAACPFCRTTSAAHVTDVPAEPWLLRQLPLSSVEVDHFLAVAAIDARYTITVAGGELIIRAKRKPKPRPTHTFRGMGATRSLTNAVPTAMTGDGATVRVRPPAGLDVVRATSRTDHVTFDAVLEDGCSLYRLSADDDVRTSPSFVSGRQALQRANFCTTRKRVCLIVGLTGGANIYLFFSRLVSEPGVIVVMPHPDADVSSGGARKQCLSLVDFYDESCWGSERPAVNHNRIEDFEARFRRML